MKKVALLTAVISLASSFAIASMGPMKGQLKDGTMVQVDEHEEMWMSKDGKQEKAVDGEYMMMHDGKEMTIVVKDGKSMMK